MALFSWPTLLGSFSSLLEKSNDDILIQVKTFSLNFLTQLFIILSTPENHLTKNFHTGCYERNDNIYSYLCFEQS